MDATEERLDVGAQASSGFVPSAVVGQTASEVGEGPAPLERADDETIASGRGPLVSLEKQAYEPPLALSDLFMDEGGEGSPVKKSLLGTGPAKEREVKELGEPEDVPADLSLAEASEGAGGTDDDGDEEEDDFFFDGPSPLADDIPGDRVFGDDGATRLMDDSPLARSEGPQGAPVASESAGVLGAVPEEAPEPPPDHSWLSRWGAKRDGDIADWGDGEGADGGDRPRRRREKKGSSVGLKVFTGLAIVIGAVGVGLAVAWASGILPSIGQPVAQEEKAGDAKLDSSDLFPNIDSDSNFYGNGRDADGDAAGDDGPSVEGDEAATGGRASYSSSAMAEMLGKLTFAGEPVGITPGEATVTFKDGLVFVVSSTAAENDAERLVEVSGTAKRAAAFANELADSDMDGEAVERVTWDVRDGESRDVFVVSNEAGAAPVSGEIDAVLLRSGAYVMDGRWLDSLRHEGISEAIAVAKGDAPTDVDGNQIVVASGTTSEDDPELRGNTAGGSDAQTATTPEDARAMEEEAMRLEQSGEVNAEDLPGYRTAAPSDMVSAQVEARERELAEQRDSSEPEPQEPEPSASSSVSTGEPAQPSEPEPAREIEQEESSPQQDTSASPSASEGSFGDGGDRSADSGSSQSSASSSSSSSSGSGASSGSSFDSSSGSSGGDASPSASAAAQPVTQPVQSQAQTQSQQQQGRSGSGASSGSSSSSAQATAPAKEWVSETGHYESVTKQVWVPGAQTKKTVTYYVCDGCGRSFDKQSLLRQHQVQTGDASSSKTQTRTESVAGAGHYETKVVGKKWVVDVPGHWE